MHKRFDDYIINIISISLVLASLILILYNLTALKIYSPDGYNIDIYSQLPSTFWTYCTIVYFIGCILILQKDLGLKVVGCVHLIINYLIIFLVPHQLGYYSYGADDELSHIGVLKNIILTGYFDITDIYPATHAIYVSLSLLCNLKPNVISLLLPSFFSILFVIGIYIFSRLLLIHWSFVSILVYPISLIYFFGHFHFSNVPNYAYFTWLPIFLFCVLKYLNQKNYQISIILTIFIIVLPFTHPFVLFFTIFLLFSLYIAHFLLRSTNIVSVKTLLGLLICSSFIWFIYSYYLYYFFAAIPRCLHRG